MKRIFLARCIVLIIVLSSLQGCDETVRSFLYPVPGHYQIPVIRKDKDRLLEVPSAERTARAIFTPAGNDLVVFFHGNGCTIHAMEDYARKLHTYGYSTLLVEYPGYGISSGHSPSEKSIYADAFSMLKHVQDTHSFKKSHTILFGQSLGTGVAMELAARHMAGLVILVSPFTSMRDVAKHHYPDMLVSMLLSENYDSISKASSVDIPVLVIHGEKDRVVPHAMGLRLHEKLKHSSIISIHGAGHNDIHYYFDSRLWTQIVSFIEKGIQTPKKLMDGNRST